MGGQKGPESMHEMSMNISKTWLVLLVTVHSAAEAKTDFACQCLQVALSRVGGHAFYRVGKPWMNWTRLWRYTQLTDAGGLCCSCRWKGIRISQGLLKIDNRLVKRTYED